MLYAGGGFQAGGASGPENIGSWNGSQWQRLPTPNGSDISQTLFALAVYDDGGGPGLFVGGDFSVPGLSAFDLARWRGNQWASLGSIGVSSGIYSLASFDSGTGAELYIGTEGAFAPPYFNHIRKWHGPSNTLTTLGTGADRVVRAMCQHHEGATHTLYMGGDFLRTNGALSRRIATWNGTQFSALAGGVGQGQGDANVRDFVTFDDGSGSGPAMYAAGRFDAINGVAARNVARWDGREWSPLGAGLPCYYSPGVRALALYDSGAGFGPALYAGGPFIGAGGGTVQYVAKWDSMQRVWTNVSHAGGPNSSVSSLVVFNDGGGPALVVGGSFSNIAGVAAQRIARWNGLAWSPLGLGLGSGPAAMIVFDDGLPGGPKLFVAGSFTTAGGAPASRIAKWNGLAWSPLSSGLNGDAEALAVFDDGSGAALFVGGTFTSAGGVAVSNIAKWSGTAWSAIPGFNGSVEALTVVGDSRGVAPGLHAAGSFTTAGGAPANRIAGWNGTSWSALNSGLNATALALAVFDDGTGAALYVGGSFSTANGQPAVGIARWQCSAPMLGDINGDGVVNITDILAVIAAWGSCAPPPSLCPADVTGDGTVNILEVLFVVAHWG